MSRLTPHGTIEVGGNTEIGASAFPDREPASKEDADMPTADTDITRPDRVPTVQKVSLKLDMNDPIVRAAYLLRVVVRFIEQNRFHGGIVRYDEARCDGYALIHDCRIAARELQSSDKAVTHG